MKISKISRLRSGLPVLIAVAGLSVGQAPVAGNAGSGKRLFDKDGCYECHGYAGQGGRDGARIAATSLNLQGFMRYVRRPTGAMPAYTQKVLTDQELTDIYAYLKAFPAAKPAKEVPLLDRLRDK
jgi:mono/diheme cytochrome c family protein